jgi:HPt (histidine-containing phosphotransfer) domain-containing protein
MQQPSKPVDTESSERVSLRVLRSFEPFFDQEAVDTVQALVTSFEGTNRDRIERIRLAVAEADLLSTVREAHSLAGSTLGANRLQALAREIESLAKAGQLDGYGGLLDAMSVEFEHACAVFRGFCADFRDRVDSA